MNDKPFRGCWPWRYTVRRGAAAPTFRSGAAVLAIVVVLLAVILVDPAVAEPAPDPSPGVPPGGGPESLTAVINNIRIWLVAILATGATLFLTVGFMRLMWANGDPGEAEKGKTALRSAAIGYAGALLAPLLVTIVAGWVS
ncbi:hypothetical protein GCM10009557_01470 [Virgisporangium ochraceum]|uniref:TrbC/VIRB2 family protein n=1 Tax=Virgisporangium ochraceum TaxID=65505 RepID=A0A8J4A3K3_9ACTN|nr:pilin [Virgisporangium ochraceum]GIJ74178.1 hypothetical protein Voc01_090950 [Virgisporangium ochraceum]